MFGRKQPPSPADLRRQAVEAESELVEQALMMVTQGGRVVVSPATSGFDGRVLLAQTGDGWHAVTVGISSPDVDPVAEGVLGRGFELSMELPADAVDLTGGRPWVVDLLSSLAVTAVQGASYGPGSRLQNGNPLDGDPASVRTHLLFAPDVRLGRVTTPGGEELRLLQLVPVDAETLERAKAEGTETVLEQLRADDPLLQARLR